VKATPPVAEWERIVTEMQLVAAQAAHGDLTIDQAAAEIDRRADRLLEKRRWMLDHGHKATP
jgi:multiple sugar transport system substrate-binding protein